MIRVLVKLDYDKSLYSIKMNGHAGQAEAGKDIVCASASMLIFTIAQYVSDLFNSHRLKKKPVINLDFGNAEIIAKPKAEYADECYFAFRTISTGFELLAHNHPQYVEFERG